MIRCFECNRADLHPAMIRLEGTVRGENYTVELPGLECPACNYKTVEGGAMPEFGRLLADQYRSSHGLLTSDEIRVRRKRLNMSQQQFAQHLGVGLASVKRWEMGKIQDQRLDELIRRKTDLQTHATATGIGRIENIVSCTNTASHGYILMEGWAHQISGAWADLQTSPLSPDGVYVSIVHQTSDPNAASIPGSCPVPLYLLNASTSRG